MLMRFDPDGTFAIDAYGALDSAPATQGTFRIERRSGALRSGAFGALPDRRDVHLPDGTSRRRAARDRHDRARLRRRLRNGVDLDPRVSCLGGGYAHPCELAASGDAAPPEDASRARGDLAPGGNRTVPPDQLLRLVCDRRSGDAWDRPRTTRVTSSSMDAPWSSSAAPVPASVEAAPDGRGRPVAVEPFVTAMRATTGRDECGHGLDDVELTWIRISSA